jgi:hypothetical protein
MALFDEIMAIDDIEKRVSTVKEWNDVQIEIRSMAGADRAELMQECTMQDPEKPNDPKAKTMNFKKAYPLILAGCCYVPGTDDKAFTREQAETLNKSKNAGPIERLVGLGLELSGLSDEAVKASEKK